MANWNPAVSGSCFSTMTSLVSTAMAILVGQGLHPKVMAILWMQGEIDGEDLTKANAYATNLAAFILAVRSQWATSDTPIILGRISNSPVFTSGTTVCSERRGHGNHSHD